MCRFLLGLAWIGTDIEQSPAWTGVLSCVLTQMIFNYWLYEESQPHHLLSRNPTKQKQGCAKT